jgi:hypothetical protein
MGLQLWVQFACRAVVTAGAALCVWGGGGGEGGIVLVLQPLLCVTLVSR